MNTIGFVSSAIISTHSNPKLISFSIPKPNIKIKTKPYSHCLSKLRVSAIKDHNPDSHIPNVADQPTKHPLVENDLGWLPAFPHVLIASMSNFTFGYHIGSVRYTLFPTFETFMVIRFLIF